jgi:hypothetical protein
MITKKFKSCILDLFNVLVCAYSLDFINPLIQQSNQQEGYNKNENKKRNLPLPMGLYG